MSNSCFRAPLEAYSSTGTGKAVAPPDSFGCGSLISVRVHYGNSHPSSALIHLDCIVGRYYSNTYYGKKWTFVIYGLFLTFDIMV